jgi:hypothetical protein
MSGGWSPPPGEIERKHPRHAEFVTCNYTIETVFRDWQSGGFHLDDSGVTDRDRFARLLPPLVIAYLWLVAVGRWVVKRGYRRLVDDGPARSWKYSLFQIGVAWKERLASYTQAIPVLLILYL